MTAHSATPSKPCWMKSLPSQRSMRAALPSRGARWSRSGGGCGEGGRLSGSHISVVSVYEALRSFQYVSMPPRASIHPSTRAWATSSPDCVPRSCPVRRPAATPEPPRRRRRVPQPPRRFRSVVSSFVRFPLRRSAPTNGGTHEDRPYNFGSVTPTCPWYFPFLSAYATSGASSPWKKISWAIPSPP